MAETDANTPKLICDVCGNPALGVCCSATGPISLAYCKECLGMHAEPEFGLQYLADVAEGNLDNLIPTCRLMHTYKDGKYIPFEEWIKDWKPTDYNDVDQNSEYVEDIQEQDIL